MNLARRKRERCYGTMTHFVYLGTQLWEGDWGVYKRPGARIDLWGEIQLKVFTSARVGEYIESSARAGTGRGLHFKVSSFQLPALSWAPSLANVCLSGREVRGFPQRAWQC